MVEALAICYGLTLAISLGYTNVEAKPDSLKVIQLYMLRCRWDMEWPHCGRDTNAAAHELARGCFNSNVACNLVDKPLSFFCKHS
jgi:hypothetical protein